MRIDRQRFLSLVLGMTSPLVGCGGGAQSEPVATTPSTVTVTVSGAPTAECIDWSPSGACLAYGQVPGTVAPTAEATYAPTGECYGWDSNGTCTEWEADDTSAPVVECMQYDPTGECISWS